MTLERTSRPPGPRSYRPPIGIPERESRRRLQGILGSLAVHILVALVFIIPVIIGEVTAVREHRNGGGPGAAGGGGGGTGGTGGALLQERVLFTPLAPAASAPAPQVQAPEPPKPEPPKEEEVPPQPVPPPTPPPPPETAPEAATTPVPPNATTQVGSAASTLGEGGGSGRDGTAGNGPGSGGGIGSGIGTGRGSGVGPGTGGGPDSSGIYPPTLVTLALPPLQPPSNVRPYRLVALFDVDEKGNTKLISFNETRDRKFNSKVREVLAEVRFRPAVRGDGTPVRQTGRFEIEYP